MVLVNFKDTFAVTNRALGGYNGWVLRPVGNPPLNITDRIVVNADTGGERYGVQEGSTNIPTTWNQEVTAGLGVAVATGANNILGIGCLAAGASGYFGYRASVDFIAAQRVLRLHRDNLAGGVTQLLTKNVSTVTGDSPNDVGVVQTLRMRVAQRDDGFRIQVYWNNDNMSNPDLEYVDPRDNPMAGLAPTPPVFGQFFLWTSNGSAASVLFFTYFNGRDYEEQAAEPFLDPNGRRTSEIITDALTRYTGDKSNADWSRSQILTFVRHAQAEILQRLGDLAYFIQPEISFTPVFDGDGVFTFPEYVEKFIRIRDKTVLGREFWPEWLGVDERGRIKARMRLPSDSSAWVMKIKLRVEGPYDETDRVAIPPRFEEALILGVVLRMYYSEGSSPAEYTIFLQEYERVMGYAHAECTKMLRMSHPSRKLFPIAQALRHSHYETDHHHRGY